MRAAMVAVDYGDLLEVTLPYNRHHFDEVLIVTTPTDDTVIAVAQDNDCTVYATEAFYEDGADFNKWKAFEEGLDYYGRHGLMVLMDADILWPKVLPDYYYQFSQLYTPRRRMMLQPSLPVPPEDRWKEYPIHPQSKEWAGYTQIFYANDPCLGEPPWHQTNWRHAGGADSFFQRKWPQDKKVRPPWEVLHLGRAGQNWCGRVSNYLDGSKPLGAQGRRQRVSSFFSERRKSKGFRHERIEGSER